MDRDEDGGEPISLTLGEAVVFLNRVGLTLELAYHHRPPVEVEGLLMSQLAEREQLRRERREAEGKTYIDVIPNRDDEAAPSWVESLPVEEG